MFVKESNVSAFRFPRWFLAVGLAAFVAVGYSSCIEQITDSFGFRCNDDSDCWDNLKCTNELCGGERRTYKEEPPKDTDGGTPEEPKAEPAKETTSGTDTNAPAERTTPPEPTTTDTTPTENPNTDTGGNDNASTEPTPEPPVEKASGCVGNVGGFGICTQDSDCCPGQTCQEIDTPAGKFKVCTKCTQDSDCPTKEKLVCCKQGDGICAPQCTAP